MKFNLIKELLEWCIGGVLLNKSAFKNAFEKAKQQKYTIKDKSNEEYIVWKSIDKNNNIFILLTTKEDQKTIIAGAQFNQIKNKVYEIIEYYVEKENSGLGTQLNTIIAAEEKFALINSEQYTKYAEKIWINFKEQKKVKIWDKELDEIYELDKIDSKASDGVTILDPQLDCDEQRVIKQRFFLILYPENKS